MADLSLAGRLLPGLPIALLIVLLVVGSACGARELAVSPSDLHSAELVAVQQIPGQGMAILLLRVASSGAEVPMFTGSGEAAAIERAWRQVRPPRPMTHELLGDLLEATGWTLERLVIDELRNGQFHAALDLKHEDGRRRLVDSRPSDGLALALRSGVGVFVSNQVLEGAAEDEPTPERARSVLTALLDG